MLTLQLCDAASERSVATRSCRDDGPVHQDLVLPGGRQNRMSGGTSGGPRRTARPWVQKEAVELISRLMAEGVGGAEGPGVPVKITTPPYIHTLCKALLAAAAKPALLHDTSMHPLY